MRYLKMCGDRPCFTWLSPPQCTGTLSTPSPRDKLRCHRTLSATTFSLRTTYALAWVLQRAPFFGLRVLLYRCVCDGPYVAFDERAHACWGRFNDLGTRWDTFSYVSLLAPVDLTQYQWNISLKLKVLRWVAMYQRGPIIFRHYCCWSCCWFF